MSLLNTAAALFIAEREAHRAYLGETEVFVDLEAAVRASFAAGEQGAWFDNADLDTLYQDSAGTTPAVVNGLVGLQLDKRLGLDLTRRNLIAYTQDFDSPAWLKLSTGAAGMVVTDNVSLAPDGTMTAASITENAGTMNAYIANYGDAAYPIHSGQAYTYSVHVKPAGRNFVFLRGHNNTSSVFSSGIIVDLVTGTIHYPSGPAAGGVSAATATDIGYGWWRITLTSTAISDNLSGSGGPGIWPAASATFSASSGTAPQAYVGDGVSGLHVWGAQIDRGAEATDYQPVTVSRGGWVEGNHRFQTTTAFKPILRGTPTGDTMLINGDYAADATGWTLESGTASFAGAGADRKVTLTNGASRAVMYQGLATTPGRVYRVRIASLDNGTSGSPTAAQLRISNVTGFPPSFLVLIAATTAREAHFVATAATTYISLGNGVTTAGVTTTYGAVEVHDVSADVVQAPYFLHYDGVDDYLVTNAIDFTGTDKVNVWAGVRKLSDATLAAFLDFEWGTDASFAMFIPAAASSGNASFASEGTWPGSTVVTAVAPMGAAPVTAIVTGIADISGNSVSVRVNGVSGAPVTTLQGTGNYGNRPLYMGRRNGTTLPYNGYESQLIIRGAASSATQIDDGEALTAQRTGVTLP